uniref:60S acidic ribosomal protein P1 n=1 Tax=Noctiluca scintillans TaxID=2966 RepID=A0A7S1ALW1_NOCSC|eukprot:CAMPEP_0194479332 /NCGR_PEP_ID=MMETSP0253-20130528/2497_1 /TAXON_ID=2966 /ORGANISM="Noctiluca scintillans" /LENGTH=123 /DNA_ID=CAMNT_0039318547 /DNA_START=41 /DNA_END=412 /DNA_ORIENTATION=-
MAAVPVDSLSAEQRDELLCTYAALILHDDGADITAEAMTSLITASGNKVEGYWPPLFSKMIKEMGMKGLIAAGGGGGGGGGAGPVSAAGGGGGGGGAAATVTEKKEEVKEEEEEEEMDFDLFG